ncbi:MAG: hypothetical protein OEW36_10640 [Hylemonella sp.]|nr:hypothetical protein [Hylemonella sp.]
MTVTMMKTMALAALCLSTVAAGAGSRVSNIPSEPDKSGKYIIYLHGSAEETEGATDKYQAAVEAIAQGSAIVLSEVRGETDPGTYALKLKQQVDSLVSKGVPPEHITIGGYSKGAVIALAAAGAIRNPKVNYVLLAGCSKFLNEKYGVDPTKAVGRILSIYDVADDKFGSCDGIIRATDGLFFKEAKLESGKGHQVFRIPKKKFIKLWRDLLIDWAGA